MSKPVLICMHGLPRSGKSTIAKQLAVRFKAPIVSRDALRLVMHGQRYAKEAEPMVKAVSRYMIEALFATGSEYVICDETNYSRAARNSLQSDKWDTWFYTVKTDVETCVQRAKDTNQEDLIPVIYDMHARHEPLADDETYLVPGQMNRDALIVYNDRKMIGMVLNKT